MVKIVAIFGLFLNLISALKLLVFSDLMINPNITGHSSFGQSETLGSYGLGSPNQLIDLVFSDSLEVIDSEVLIA